MSIERRIEKAEAALNLSGEPVVHRIVLFGGAPLPADERRGTVLLQHVVYGNSERTEKPGEPGH